MEKREANQTYWETGGLRDIPGPWGAHPQPEKELGWVGPSQMVLPISQRGKLRSSRETQQQSAGVEGPHCAHERLGLSW